MLKSLNLKTLRRENYGMFIHFCTYSVCYAYVQYAVNNLAGVDSEECAPCMLFLLGGSPACRVCPL
jgi:hypothetical protein